MTKLQDKLFDRIIDKLLGADSEESVNIQPYHATINEVSNIYTRFIGKKCIVRTYSAGVFFATIADIEVANGVGHCNAILNDCRRIFYWDGATETSELSIHGIKNKDNSKLTVATNNHLACGIVEIFECTNKSIENLESIKVWSQHE